MMTNVQLSYEQKSKEIFEYAWKWFDFYAKQRTTMFNFYIILGSLLLNGFILARKNADSLPNHITSWLCAFGITVSIIFMLLDYRNRKLIDIGEDMLRFYEESYLCKGLPETFDKRYIGFMTREEKEIKCGQDKSVIRHKYLFPAIYISFMMVYFMLAII